MKNLSFASLFFCLVFIVLCKQSVAQNFHLVKDINTATDSYPSNGIFDYNAYSHNALTSYAVLNGIAYFNANDGLHPTGLWRSDGTNAGTYLLKDSVDPQGITTVNGKLFFSVSNSTNGLWTSDGTTEGTAPLLSKLPAGLFSFNAYNFTAYRGMTFFTINSVNATRSQLWKTDGTESGTVLVKNFGDTGLNLAHFNVVKGKLFFSVENHTNGIHSKLWVSDGSTENTRAVSDDVLDPSPVIPASSQPGDLRIFFSGIRLGSYQRKLFLIDSTTGGVVAANGFYGSITYNNNEPLISKDGFIYFLGSIPGNSDNENLYKYDFNSSYGQVTPITSITGSSSVDGLAGVVDLVEANGALFFKVHDTPNGRYQLWKTDGTSAGNVLLKDSLDTYNFINVNGTIFFSGQDNAHGNELWKSDGTVNGTTIVKDIITGVNSGSPLGLTDANNKLLFSATDSTAGLELWQSDGTAGGTSMVKDINQTTTGWATPYNLTRFNNSLIFSAYEGLGKSPKIWKTDGTSTGTVIISDTVSGGGFPSFSYTVRNTETYFWGYSISGKQGLYKTNGTSSGTVLIKDFPERSVDFIGMTATDNLVFFYFNNYTTGFAELWRTDGSNENTYSVKTNIYFLNNGTNQFVAAESTLYFAPYNSKSLWKTDGTVAGTVMVKSFYYDLPELIAHNGKVFFSLYDGSNYYLWKSDGTAEGTIKVTDKLTSPSNFISSNGQVFFSGLDNSGFYGNVGTELFKTDGTDSGTVLVKDIHPGAESSMIYVGKSINGTLYFFTNRSGTDAGVSLWKTDGSDGGTRLLSNIETSNYLYPNKLETCNGKLFFVLNSQLWQSDGTASGTHTVTDNIFKDLTIEDYGSYLTAAGNQLFFVAIDDKYGEELYAGNVANDAVPVYTTAADGNWNDPATWIGNVVPPAGAIVTVKHKVTANVNTTCSGVWVEASGELTVPTGINITMLH